MGPPTPSLFSLPFLPSLSTHSLPGQACWPPRRIPRTRRAVNQPLAQHPTGAEARLPLPVDSGSPAGEAAKSSVHKTKSGYQRPRLRGGIRVHLLTGYRVGFPPRAWVPVCCWANGVPGALEWSGESWAVPVSEGRGPLASHSPATLCNSWSTRQDQSHDGMQVGARPAVGGHWFSAALTATAGQAGD